MTTGPRKGQERSPTARPGRPRAHGINLERTPVSLTLIRPDDWHVHLRDEALLRAVLPDTVRRFARAIVMPNLKSPVRTVAEARAYRERILAARPAGSAFEPLMTLYLTDNTPVAEIERARASGFVHGVKYYPAGATTHSDFGVTDIGRCDDALAAMEALSLPLLVHGEVTDSAVDVFDREAVFIDRILQRIVARFPNLKIVLEHVTTRDGVEFVMAAPATVAATLTAHHLLLNRNAMFHGGIRPHAYCLPVLKRERHREALVAAAVSGSPKFFLGTDSAPHVRRTKEAACGCAGVYTAHAGIELYAEVFKAAGALAKLEGFASLHGPAFYGLAANRERITLIEESWPVAAAIDLAPAGMDDTLVPFRAGESVGFRIAEVGV
ncbi:dihydroorotase [Acidiferrobacter thiooxydans]|nr:dihydroorotase [Acidiferrobacter thiooxydans]UEO00685.1 dihydroorotase [Acidiferrobacter thiooxydans]